MRNIWRVFTRDVMRIVRVPKAWIIIVGVIVTPSLYAWFNIVAFWDPYANTQNITVAVANLDEGATSDLTGSIDVGAEVVEQLSANTQLGWTFMDEDEAMSAVRSGEAYAAIVIPAEFSEDLISITTGSFTQPTLQYYVNEKANAIAPKITDVGASTLEAQITSSFTSTVSEAVAEALKDAGTSVESSLLTAQTNTVTAIDNAIATVTTARGNLSELQTSLADTRAKLSSARGTLGTIDTTLGDVQTAIAQTQSIVAEVQQGVITFTDSVSSAYVNGAVKLADASSQANASIGALAQGIQQANTTVGAGLTQAQAVVTAGQDAIDRLQALVDAGGLDPTVTAQLNTVIDALRTQTDNSQSTLAQLQTLNGALSNTVTAVQDAADGINTAVQDAATAAGDVRTILLQTIPGLNQALSDLSTSAGSFSAALGAQRTLLGQASTLLGNLDTQLVATGDAVASLDQNLQTVQSGLGTARTDVLALSSAAIFQNLSSLTGLDVDAIAQFMASPVEVSQEVVYPIDSYGSAMAALFTNLSLWIGAFVLMVILKLEVDREGLEDVSVRQAYLGRWLLLASIAFFQAIVLSIGNLVIGVQHVNAFAFVGTTVLIGLAYLSIIYALSVSFGYVGKGLAVLLIIMQIPGASGLYPIEMMPAFFRALYPFFPFSYGIDAMREVISGFYGNHYWRYLGVLGIFVVLAFVLGLFLRRWLGNLNRLFNRELRRTDLLISEEVQITGGGYQLSQIIHALSNRDEYREELARKAGPFLHSYPVLQRWALGVGLAVVAVLGVISAVIPGGKAALLGIWVVWSLLVVAFLITIEYVRHSLRLAGEVSEMDETALRTALAGKGAALGWGRVRAARSRAEERGTAERNEPAEETTSDVDVFEELFGERGPGDDDPAPGSPGATR